MKSAESSHHNLEGLYHTKVAHFPQRAPLSCALAQGHSGGGWTTGELQVAHVAVVFVVVIVLVLGSARLTRILHIRPSVC